MSARARRHAGPCLSSPDRDRAVLAAVRRKRTAAGSRWTEWRERDGHRANHVSGRARRRGCRAGRPHVRLGQPARPQPGGVGVRPARARAPGGADRRPDTSANRPALEVPDELVFAEVNTISWVAAEEAVRLERVQLVPGDGLVVSVDRNEPAVERVSQDLRADAELAGAGPAAVLSRVLDHAVERYGPVLSALNDAVDEAPQQRCPMTASEGSPGRTEPWRTRGLRLPRRPRGR